MRELPIIFNNEMVKAIDDCRKTVSSRTNGLEVVNGRPDEVFFSGLFNGGKRTLAAFRGKSTPLVLCSAINTPCEIGDLLYVREAFTADGFEDNYVYRAQFGDLYKWKPAIHMPKAAARLWLRVTDVKVERLQDISDSDAISEGIETYGDEPLKFYNNYGSGKDFLYDSVYGFNHGKEKHTAPVASFCTLWISIYGRENWILNPWVWRIKFEKIDK